jgi:hypothetical protein
VGRFIEASCGRVLHAANAVPAVVIAQAGAWQTASRLCPSGPMTKAA